MPGDNESQWYLPNCKVELNRTNRSPRSEGKLFFIIFKCIHWSCEVITVPLELLVQSSHSQIPDVKLKVLSKGTKTSTMAPFLWLEKSYWWGNLSPNSLCCADPLPRCSGPLRLLCKCRKVMWRSYITTIMTHCSFITHQVTKQVMINSILIIFPVRKNYKWCDNSMQYMFFNRTINIHTWIAENLFRVGDFNVLNVLKIQ